MQRDKFVVKIPLEGTEHWRDLCSCENVKNVGYVLIALLRCTNGPRDIRVEKQTELVRE